MWSPKDFEDYEGHPRGARAERGAEYMNSQKNLAQKSKIRMEARNMPPNERSRVT